MEQAKGYYSLIQYCPDFGRLETVNLGVVILCPDKSFLEARFANSNERAHRLFGSEEDNSLINSAKRAMGERIRALADENCSLEGLTHFMKTRGNNLILTAPRPMVVGEPSADLERLFAELVADNVRAGNVARELVSVKIEEVSNPSYAK